MTGEETPKGRDRWSVVPVSGRGLRLGAGLRRCPPWYCPQEEPGREQEQGTGRRRRIGGARARGAPSGPRPAAELPRAGTSPFRSRGSGRHHGGQRRGPAHDRDPPPLTPASRLPQPALPVFLPSHGGADGSGARSGRSWMSRPPKPGPPGPPEAATGPRTRPIHTTALGFAQPEVNAQTSVSVKTFRKRKESATRARCLTKWGADPEF